VERERRIIAKPGSRNAMKSHTPECATIEQFAATLVPIQDFDSKDYALELQGRSITITKEQFDDGTWQEIVRRAVQ
jgi:hypothetical protein